MISKLKNTIQQFVMNAVADLEEGHDPLPLFCDQKVGKTTVQV